MIILASGRIGISNEDEMCNSQQVTGGERKMQKQWLESSVTSFNFLTETGTYHFRFRRKDIMSRTVMTSWEAQIGVDKTIEIVKNKFPWLLITFVGQIGWSSNEFFRKVTTLLDKTQDEKDNDTWDCDLPKNFQVTCLWPVKFWQKTVNATESRQSMQPKVDSQCNRK